MGSLPHFLRSVKPLKFEMKVSTRAFEAPTLDSESEYCVELQRNAKAMHNNITNWVRVTEASEGNTLTVKWTSTEGTIRQEITLYKSETQLEKKEYALLIYQKDSSGTIKLIGRAIFDVGKLAKSDQSPDWSEIEVSVTPLGGSGASGVLRLCIYTAGTLHAGSKTPSPAVPPPAEPVQHETAKDSPKAKEEGGGLSATLPTAGMLSENEVSAETASYPETSTRGLFNGDLAKQPPPPKESVIPQDDVQPPQALASAVSGAEVNEGVPNHSSREVDGVPGKSTEAPQSLSEKQKGVEAGVPMDLSEKTTQEVRDMVLKEIQTLKKLPVKRSNKRALAIAVLVGLATFLQCRK